MKILIDMNAAVVTKRLQQVEALRRTCLALADSGAGRQIRSKFSANKSVQRTSHALGR
jgi:hypothetical protein